MGIPAEVVVDRTLNREIPPHLEALIIVDPLESLTTNQKSRIRDFIARRGELIDASSLSWGTTDYTTSRTWLLNRLRRVAQESFVQVRFPENRKQRTFTVLAGRTDSGEEKKILLIPNDFSWVTRFGPDQVTQTR